MDDVQEPAAAPPPGDITQAYLDRDVHPDELPGVKPSHSAMLQTGGAPFPKEGGVEEPHPCEDTWLYH